MLRCVQLRRGETRNFTFGHATMNTMTVRLEPGKALVINRGTNTTFVKCGMHKVQSVQIVTLRLGEKGNRKMWERANESSSSSSYTWLTTSIDVWEKSLRKIEISF